MQRMLNRVPDNVDKREGSIIWDALAPAAVELAQMYAELGINNDLSYADTASGDFLTRRAAEFGVNRFPATKALRKGLFFDGEELPFDVPLRSRFSIGELDYVVVSRVADGEFALECESKGIVGNLLFGPLVPIDYIEGLSHAELGDVLIPGEDEEDDSALLNRYIEAVNEPSFGGNITDYKKKVGKIEGIGGVKVFPTWQGGGTVKCTIISSELNVPSLELVNKVQTVVDPEVNQGQGLGTAPIGHTVTISGVSAVNIDVTTTVTLDSETTIGQIQGDIEDVLSDYFLSLRKAWKDEEILVVRTAQIDARLLTVQGVVDIQGTMLNGFDSNIELGAEEIPVLGTVTVNE